MFESIAGLTELRKGFVDADHPSREADVSQIRQGRADRHRR